MFSEHELDVLHVTQTIVQLFQEHPDAVWPGFDLSRQPFLVYVPGKWALLVNAPPEAPEFGPCPPGWPSFGTAVLYHEGQYQDLVGQLAFDLPLAGLKVAAIGLPDGLTKNSEFPRAALFDFITHENFHQFQSQSFGEIQWEREERYPILDAGNSALAYVELALLKDALDAIRVGDRKEIETLAGLFAAVRAERWNRGSPFIRKYEQGQEIREGTAQYAQTKSMQILLQDAGRVIAEPFKEELKRISLHAYRLRDFEGRMKDNFIEPDDMIRNRIYPLGSTLGLLADTLGIDWKKNAQLAGPDFAFHELFARTAVRPGQSQGALLAEAKKRYDFDRILAATRASIDAYRGEFQKALGQFESQTGSRVEISFSYRGLSRSRVGLEKRWVMDDGAVSLGTRYRTYALKNDELNLQVQDSGILEKDDWDGKKKEVIFYSSEITVLRLDGSPLDPAVPRAREFKELEVEGRGFVFKTRQAGTLALSAETITIKLPDR
jgi:hypothetical protein